MHNWPYFEKLSRTMSDVLAWNGGVRGDARVASASAAGGGGGTGGAEPRQEQQQPQRRPAPRRRGVDAVALVGTLAAAGLALAAFRSWRSSGSGSAAADSRQALDDEGDEMDEMDEADEVERELAGTRLTLRATEELCARVAGVSHGSLWEWDLTRNRIAYSPEWTHMLGYAAGELGDESGAWLGRVHPDDLAQLLGEIAACREGRIPALSVEYRLLHRDGTYRWMHCRAQVAAHDTRTGEALRLIGSQLDVSRRVQAEQALLQAAARDPLTGLPNRGMMLDLIARAVARGRRHPDSSFAVLFIDFDRFKFVNDSLGHAAGDELLIAVARRLQICLRPEDALGRLGGDEYIVLLEGIHDVSDATGVADRMMEMLSQPFSIAGHEVTMTASIGIVIGTPEYEQPEELLRDADLAMYRAKALGKACYEVFDVDLRTTARARAQLESDLRRALERGEFGLCYQPIVSLGTGEIAGFEALIRWRHPERGTINAAAFVPLAEESGAIVPIGRWVLREACRQVAQWQNRYPGAPPVSVSVNLSPREIFQPRLVRHVQDVLKETGLPPECLKLEITESVFMDDVEAAVETLGQLRALGVHLHLDDFGTGYSSLSYLHRFPIDTVKIDRYFVSRLEVNADCYEIVRTMLELARNLGMNVIAEGAETAEQHEQLKLLQCPFVQGYFFSRPVSPEDAERMLMAEAGAKAVGAA